MSSADNKEAKKERGFDSVISEEMQTKLLNHLKGLREVFEEQNNVVDNMLGTPLEEFNDKLNTYAGVQLCMFMKCVKDILPILSHLEFCIEDLTKEEIDKIAKSCNMSVEEFYSKFLNKLFIETLGSMLS